MSFRRLGVAAALALLGACAGVPENEPEPEAAPVVAVAPARQEPRPAAASPAPASRPERVVPSEPEISELDALLADFELLRRLPASDVLREYDAARHAFNQSHSDAARVKLAMTSMVPGIATGEEARALELLDPLVKNPAAPLHGLAFLLSAHIQEQRRLTALAQGLQQNVQGLQQNNQTLQQNVHGLQQKLDALRTLERSLTERAEPSPRRR